MIHTSLSFTRLRRRLRLAAVSVPALVGFALLGGQPLQAKPVPSNLGNGLDKLVESNLALAELQGKRGGAVPEGAVTVNGKTYSNAQAASYGTLALSEASTGRVMVRVNADGTVPLPVLKRTLGTTIGSFQLLNSVDDYQGVGVLEAYISVDDAALLGNTKGVRSVILEFKPRHNRSAINAGATEKARTEANPQATNGQVLNKLGTAFDQGVTQHKVDTINRGYNGLTTGPDYEGQGMKIACISNSYGSNPTKTPAIDVANGDLPGAANPYNTTEVYILQDDVGDGTVDDEGRAMCQIAYKMCPKASIAFATADGGELGFANNIRLLSGLTVNGVTGTFGADCVCDDVGYYDEPFFQDGIIAQGIDDANAFGVSYFSSAANDIGVNGYDSDTRWVANGTGLTATAGNTALTNTNIDLTGVPTNLYAGGFHNFNPAGLDVAQTNNVSNGGVPTVLQWNDPYDQNTTPTYTATLFTANGNYTTADQTYTVPATITAGVLYEVAEAATNSSVFDGVVTVYRSDGTTVIAGPQDTGGDETVRFFAPVNDTGFVVKIGHFSTTMGTYSVTVKSASTYPKPIPSHLSLLVFNLTTGAYISSSSLTQDTVATNEPIQIGTIPRPTGATQVQYVIARAAVPAQGFNYPTHLRFLLPGNGASGLGPAEYFTYNTVTTGGHAAAAGCNGACAYPFYRPSIPESFSSPGPVMIYYDKNGNALATPQVRLKPTIAATDAANISTNMNYFSGDITYDTDTNPNFSGTSAASPHSMSVGCLALQAHGGRRSLTPAQLTSILQRSTFPHDLDPGFSSGTARVTGGVIAGVSQTGKVTITCASDNSANGGTGSNDNNSISISYVGGSAITSFVFNPGGTAATAGGTSNGNNGVQYSTTATGGTATYFSNDYPGMVFATATKAFTVGSASTVATANVAATPSNLAGAPSTTQNYTLTLVFTGGTFTGGNVLRFNVGRSIQHSGVTGNTSGTVGAGSTVANYNGDLLGGTILLPDGTGTGTGMSFSGTTADGGSFAGTINNRIGAGYSVLDGFGFIDASKAVTATVQ